MKDIGKLKIVMKWKITRNSVIGIMKINQSLFLRKIVIEESFTNCSALVISMKAESLIEMLNFDNYKGIKYYKY